jgi:hypothetical protein
VNRLLAIVVALMALSSLRGVRRYWNVHEDDPRYRMASYWPWGEDSWNAFTRSFLLGPYGLACLALALGVSTLRTYAGLAFFATILPAITIALFNRPKLLVPPGLRAQKGMLASRAERRKTGERKA